MSDSFIPRPDHLALAWMTTYADNIAASPHTYELSVSDSNAISSAVDEFRQALIISDNEMTRNAGTVNVKDTKRNAAESLCRQFAMQIKFNNGITDEQKIYIGVRPVNDSREPIFCPQSSPLINVKAATPGSHTITYADALDPAKKAKPFGAASIQIFAHIGENATENVDDASFVGLFTRNPIVTEYGDTDDGKMATYFARWSGVRGDTGPWSLPISMRIAA
jgi:hypothetical protein